jgi:hypothetical protein
MQIRIIIKYKYSYSHQKSIATIRNEKREFLYPFLQIKRETPNNPSKIKGYRGSPCIS